MTVFMKVVEKNQIFFSKSYLHIFCRREIHKFIYVQSREKETNKHINIKLKYVGKS